MDYLQRLKNVQIDLNQKCDEALLLEDPTDIFYLTGIELSLGKLLLTFHDSFLVVDGRYFEQCERSAAHFSIISLKAFKWQDWFLKHAIRSLKFDSQSLSYDAASKLIAAAEKSNVSFFPEVSPLARYRSIKDKQELEHLRHAAELNYRGLEKTLSLLKTGVSEEEVARGLEIFWKEEGAKALSFDPIIAFGENSAMPHYRAGGTKLFNGMNVLIDIGVSYKHYQSDMTRTFFWGTPNSQIEEIYAIVAEAKRRAIAMCVPGTPIKQLDHVARQFIESKGFGAFFNHSLGHGVGLDIHEPPVIRGESEEDSLLKPGMVITIEPGIYLPTIGGVRLEDTLCITENGHENFYSSLPLHSPYLNV